MTAALFDSWVVMALLAAAAWALSCVIDVCFVGNGVYRRPSDGPAIAGLFCLLPAITSTPSLSLAELTGGVVAVGLLSGVCYLLHVHYYFKALFIVNDAVNAEIFNTLSVLIVPVVAFVLLGERLAWQNYAAIGVAAAGIVVLVGFQLARMPAKAIAYMVAAVVSISLVMVLQAWILQRASYATSIWIFSASACLVTLFVFGIPRRRRQRVVGLCRRFGAIFVMVELLNIAAVLGSQRATDLGPSVSLVALLECTLPIFVMLFSGIAAVVASQWRRLRSTELHTALIQQIAASPPKFASMSLIAVAVVIIGTGGTF